MSNLIPEPMTKDELVYALELLVHHVKEGDSFEGHFEYLMPDPDRDPPEAEFMVTAGYRFGNATHGQGFFRLIGKVPAQEPPS
jgi:hypothetical protein